MADQTVRDEWREMVQNLMREDLDGMRAEIQRLNRQLEEVQRVVSGQRGMSMDITTQPAIRWEYRFVQANVNNGETELAHAGQDGWEAVGVTTHGTILTVLLKRPLAPGRNAS